MTFLFRWLSKSGKIIRPSASVFWRDVSWMLSVEDPCDGQFSCSQFDRLAGLGLLKAIGARVTEASVWVPLVAAVV